MPRRSRLGLRRERWGAWRGSEWTRRSESRRARKSRCWRRDALGRGRLRRAAQGGLSTRRRPPSPIFSGPPAGARPAARRCVLTARRRGVRRVALPARGSEGRPRLALILLSLESAPPAAAVEAIRISVDPRAPRAAQADMFVPPCPAPERLHVTLARLAALCGPGKG